MKLKFIKLRASIRNFYQTRIQPPPEQTVMHSKIMLFIHEPQQKGEALPRVDWIISDPQGTPVQTVMNGELSQLQPTEGDEMLVIVPAQETVLTQAALPKLSAYRLQQALPYALEEQVLDELELLHFAAGPYQASEGQTNLPVAIIKKALMEQWLRLLQQSGIQPDFMTPAIFALPFKANQWQILLSENQATVRTGLYTGFSSELQNLETLLSLKLQEETQLPDQLIIYHDKKQTFSFQALALPTEKIALTPKQELELKAQTLASFPYLNLLQTPYTSTRKLKIPEKNKKAWQLAALALSLWLGLLFVGKLGSLLTLSFEHQHLQNIITETYQAHFPEAKTAVNPKAKLEAKLKKALAQSEKNRLFQWLGYIAKTASSIRIQSLNFQNNQLSLDLIASSFSSLDDFILSLKAEGIEAKQQNATMAGSQVKAVLLIEGKTA